MFVCRSDCEVTKITPNNASNVKHFQNNVFCFAMQASTVEKAAYLRPQFNPIKTKQQKEQAVKPSFFKFTEKDLYDYLHQKNGKVETINLEESRNRKLEENGAGTDKQSSCKLICLCSKVFFFVCLFVLLEISVICKEKLFKVTSFQSGKLSVLAKKRLIETEISEINSKAKRSILK